MTTYQSRSSSGRRAADIEVGERMTRVEERLSAISATVTEQASSIVRIHERIDEMESKITDFMNTIQDRISGTVEHMERRLATHIDDEEKLNAARLETIKQVLERIEGNFTGSSKNLDKLEEDFEEKLQATNHDIREIKKTAWSLVIISLGALASFGGFLGTFLFNHHEAINRLLEILDKVK